MNYVTMKHFILLLAVGCTQTSLQALQKTKEAVVQQAKLATSLPAQADALTKSTNRWSFTCSPEQRIFVWSATGAMCIALLLYYRKNCIAHTLDFWDWVRRVYLTQMERDERFFRAMDEGRLNDAERWWYRGANVNGVVDGKSSLHAVAQRGNEKAARWLIMHGADINKQDSSGQTPAMHAVMHPQMQTTDLIYLFRQHGAKFDILDSSKESVLHKAVQHPTIHTERFIANLISPATINGQDLAQETPLLKLIIPDDPLHPIDVNLLTRIANALLTNQADIHLKDAEDKTPLLRAVRFHYMQLMRNLLNQSTSHDVAEVEKALQEALTYQRWDMIDPLMSEVVALKSSTDARNATQLRDVYERKLFHWTIDTGNHEHLQQFITVRKPSPALLQDYVWYVVQSPDPKPEIVRCLFHNGASVFEKKDGETALLKVVKQGAKYNAIARVILESAFVDLNIQHGAEVLLCADANGMRILSREISDMINHKDNIGLNAVDYALQQNNQELVKLLDDATINTSPWTSKIVQTSKAVGGAMTTISLAFACKQYYDKMVAAKKLLGGNL